MRALESAAVCRFPSLLATGPQIVDSIGNQTSRLLSEKAAEKRGQLLPPSRSICLTSLRNSMEPVIQYSFETMHEADLAFRK